MIFPLSLLRFCHCQVFVLHKRTCEMLIGNTDTCIHDKNSAFSRRHLALEISLETSHPDYRNLASCLHDLKKSGYYRETTVIHLLKRM